MAKLSQYQVPPPADWQVFERLCADLWRRIWGDPMTQLYGRRGQEQEGVDVIGRPGLGTRWAAVQCKHKDRLVGKALGRQAMQEEVDKAAEFNPRLSELIFATTGAGDKALQKAARDLSKLKGMAVSVLAWDEIVRRLEEFPELVAKYYPEHAAAEDLKLLSERRFYLQALSARWQPVHLLAASGGRRRESVPLAAVYTALDVQKSTCRPGRF